MSFAAQGLNLSTYSANEVAPRIHTYSSSVDTLGAITSDPKYFGSVAPVVSVNDVFYISDCTGLPNGKGFFYVENASIYYKTVALNSMGNSASAVIGTVTATENTAFQITGMSNLNATLTAAIPGAVVGAIYPAMFTFDAGGELPGTFPAVVANILNTNLYPAPGLETAAFYFIKIIAVAPTRFSIYSTLADATSGANAYTIDFAGNNASVNIPIQMLPNYGYTAQNIVGSTVPFILPPAIVAGSVPIGNPTGLPGVSNLNVGDTIHFANQTGANVYIFQNPGQQIIIGAGVAAATSGFGGTLLADGVVNQCCLESNTVSQAFDLVVLSNTPATMAFPYGQTMFNLVNGVNVIGALQYL
jgi:hypothetical protein